MSDTCEMSTGESLETWINLLRLVVLKDETAEAKIHEALKDPQVKVLDVKTFDFYRKGLNQYWEDCCDCWFTNEYLEYINGNGVDFELFESVIDSFRRGRCPHVLDEDFEVSAKWIHTNSVKKTGISLIHAAAAAGNETVIKYLLTSNKHLKCCTTTTATLPPVIIAVLKNRAALIKCLHAEVKSPPSDIFDSDNVADCSDNEIDLSSGMEVAARNAESEKVTIKKTLWYGNPFVDIRYADVAPTESTIEVIKCYLTEQEIHKVLRYVLYKHERQVATKVVSCFSKYVGQFNADLVLECILWDNLDSLNIILGKFKADIATLQYSGYSFVSIAEFLNHVECARKLQDFCTRFDGRSEGRSASKQRPVLGADQNEQQSNTGNSEPADSPFSIILKLAVDKNFDRKQTCELVLKLCHQGYDINSRKERGLTPLQICIITDRSIYFIREVMETLLSQGADVNLKHFKTGRTALHWSLKPYDYPRLERIYPPFVQEYYLFISLMKAILYYNAVPAYTNDAVYHALIRDRSIMMLRYVHDPSATVILSKLSATGKEVIAETTREKYLALSSVAILIELGFPMERSWFSLLDEVGPELTQYVNEILCTPRSLVPLIET